MMHPPPEPLNQAHVLLFVRHGEAAPRNAVLSDFERVLTRHGAEACERVAKSLRTMHERVDTMISSPANRALETAHLFARHLSYPYQNIRLSQSLYYAHSIRPVLADLRKLEDSVCTVALFGHNPMFDDLVTYFIPRYADQMPKGAVAAIGLTRPTWAGLAPGQGELRFALWPSRFATHGVQAYPGRR